ncbi:MAG: nucleoside recognition domain-containing protein [Eubacteriales bacterium]|nr:nucleoside recognition domain-containing protein [Eubacteriales bacterium]
MRRLLTYAGCTAFLTLLCWYSADCADAVRAAIELCLRSAVPSLFPFFAASSLAVSCGMAQSLGNLLSPLTRRIFHLPGCGAAALVLGFLGGYPAGACMAAELWRSGACSQSEAEALLSVCNNTGPAFLIGMCGGGLFHSLRAGLFLYAVHICSALLAAVLFRPKACPPTVHKQTQSEDIPFFRCLTQSVLSAGRSCLMVSAFILFFSIILCLLRLTGLLPALCRAAAPLFSPLGLSESGTLALLTGCAELTQGLAGITGAAGTTAARLTAVSFLCAFGGASVLFQSAAAAEGLRISRCIRGKCLHACLAALLCILLLRLLPCPV